MNMIEAYCGEFEYTKLRFTFNLLDEVQQKIQHGTLFYESQIYDYAKKRLDQFFRTLRLSPALSSACKNEMWITITHKLKSIVEEKRMLRCV
jgi:hypothetical protein